MVAAFVVVFASTMTPAGEPEWFDMEKCGFCKYLMDPPEMLEHATWEHHNISNGIVSVTTIDKEYLKPFMAAMAKMEETGKKMEKGEMVEMCGACTAMGQLMMKGAKWESVNTKHGTVALMISDDPEVVKGIQMWGKRSMDEMAKMEKMEKEHKKEKKTHAH